MRNTDSPLNANHEKYGSVFSFFSGALIQNVRLQAALYRIKGNICFMPFQVSEEKWDKSFAL